MNTDQLNSFVRSLLKIIGAILLAHGATKAAAIVNTEDVAGVIITLVGLFESHRFHSQDAIARLISEFGKGPYQTAETPTQSGAVKTVLVPSVPAPTAPAQSPVSSAPASVPPNLPSPISHLP